MASYSTYGLFSPLFSDWFTYSTLLLSQDLGPLTTIFPRGPPVTKRSDFSGVVSSLLKRHNAGTTQTLPRLSGLSVQKKKLWDQMLPESLHLYRRVGALYYIRSHIFVNPKKSLNYPTTSRKIWGKAPEAQQYYRPGSLLKSYMDLHLLPNKSRPKYYYANTLNFNFGYLLQFSSVAA